MAKDKLAKNGKPWYHFPIVWMIFFIPAIAVIMSGVLLAQAIITFDGLVDDDYYKKGKEISQTLQRDDYSNEHQMQIILTINQNLPAIKARFLNQLQWMPDTIQLKLIHPTRKGRDVETNLIKQQDNEYLAAFPLKIEDGKWLVRAENETFRLQKEIIMPYSGEFSLDAKTIKSTP